MGNSLGPLRAARVVGSLFGLIFCGTGITVLAFLWSQPFGEFGSPPIFFRIFGSFIALGFVVVGGGMAIGTLLGRGLVAKRLNTGEEVARSSPEPPPNRTGGYVCPHCGASLGEKADVSPLGDVRCTFCGSWFNVHRRT